MTRPAPIGIPDRTGRRPGTANARVDELSALVDRLLSAEASPR